MIHDVLKQITETGCWRARQYLASVLCCSNIPLNEPRMQSGKLVYIHTNFLGCLQVFPWGLDSMVIYG